MTELGVLKINKGEVTEEEINKELHKLKEEGFLATYLTEDTECKVYFLERGEDKQERKEVENRHRLHIYATYLERRGK
ncbi:MAG: hypothetical protein PHC62_00460 [Candidatus Izemoplasmatales bacterium]|nr:hypothetical protein [Candidatus Izemoplasmatales bacterium]